MWDKVFSMHLCLDLVMLPSSLHPKQKLPAIPNIHILILLLSLFISSLQSLLIYYCSYLNWNFIFFSQIKLINKDKIRHTSQSKGIRNTLSERKYICIFYLFYINNCDSLHCTWCYINVNSTRFWSHTMDQIFWF